MPREQTTVGRSRGRGPSPIATATLAVGLAFMCSACTRREGVTKATADGGPLLLEDFAPRSKLHAALTDVPRARFPAIDFHQHTYDGYIGTGELDLQHLVEAMDRHNVRTLVILTGGWGQRLRRKMDELVRRYPGRFVLFTQVDWSRIDEPDFGRKMAAQIRESVAAGARGLKILKELGLGVRDREGRLIAVDDARLDPIWNVCGEIGIPVAIHTSDPEAFFDPVDRHNERYEELRANPDWSFHGGDFPSKRALIEARDRIFARHPRTTFVALHVANWPENLDYVSDLLRRFPNVYVEIGARQAELGRQPQRARRFFLDFPDRILFGTDVNLGPFNDYGASYFSNYFRWLETGDEHFPYAGYPAQGRWMIYGINLPEAVLESVYRRNAETVLTGRPTR